MFSGKPRVALGSLIVIFKFALGSNPTNPIISSPEITNWGQWGTFDSCSIGMFARGVRLKVEPVLCGGDNTGINGISFLCDNLNGGNDDPNKNPHYIMSDVGIWGKWENNYACRDGYILGFQLRSQSYQGSQDDFAATNLRVNCSSGEIIEGDGSSWGDWTSFQNCPDGHAICGMQSQVEEPQGDKSDDTSLNNLKAECCPLL